MYARAHVVVTRSSGRRMNFTAIHGFRGTGMVAET
jgi:hypothetical protein